MAQDEQYLYVADCGNNRGERLEFQLYSIRWSDLVSATERVASERIHFRLADRRAGSGYRQHDNDCEAIARVGDGIWLLTKGWASGHSRLYQLDLHSREQQLQTLAEWPVGGLVTAMDYSARRQELAVLGYTLGRFSSETFLWRIPVRKGKPQWEEAVRDRLWPSGQWEAVLWQGDDLLLTRESSLLGAARLGRVRLD